MLIRISDPQNLHIGDYITFNYEGGTLGKDVLRGGMVIAKDFPILTIEDKTGKVKKFYTDRMTNVTLVGLRTYATPLSVVSSVLLTIETTDTYRILNRKSLDTIITNIENLYVEYQSCPIDMEENV